MTLLSTRPDQDRAVLVTGERLVREVASQTGLRVPAGIELRMYPDVESFRNATGEPGWVAARTTGRRIEMQPAATLRSRGALESTLRHEILHAFLEAQAAPGLPVWFREGLAAYLSAGQGRAASVPEADIRRRDDEGRARSASAAAAARVGELIRRYGMATVISWLNGTLPEGLR